jgi:hypothetical protein
MSSLFLTASEDSIPVAAVDDSVPLMSSLLNLRGNVDLFSGHLTDLDAPSLERDMVASYDDIRFGLRPPGQYCSGYREGTYATQPLMPLRAISVRVPTLRCTCYDAV